MPTKQSLKNPTAKGRYKLSTVTRSEIEKLALDSARLSPQNIRLTLLQTCPLERRDELRHENQAAIRRLVRKVRKQDEPCAQVSGRPMQSTYRDLKAWAQEHSLYQLWNNDCLHDHDELVVIGHQIDADLEIIHMVFSSVNLLRQVHETRQVSLPRPPTTCMSLRPAFRTQSYPFPQEQTDWPDQIALDHTFKTNQVGLLFGQCGKIDIRHTYHHLCFSLGNLCHTESFVFWHSCLCSASMFVKHTVVDGQSVIPEEFTPVFALQSFPPGYVLPIDQIPQFDLKFPHGVWSPQLDYVVQDNTLPGIDPSPHHVSAVRANRTCATSLTRSDPVCDRSACSAAHLGS